MSTISSTPEPLPHGATGEIAYETTRKVNAWAEVGLLLDDNDYTAVSVLALYRGETSFSFGPTATWDGASGGQIVLRLFYFANGVQKTLATGTGTYL